MEGGTINTLIGNEPIFNPTYLNIEYFFYRVFHLGSGFREFWQDNETIIRVISYTITAFLLAIIVYSIYGIVKIWQHEEEHLEHEAHAHAHGGHGDHGHDAHGGGHADVHGGEHDAHGAVPMGIDATPAGREWDGIITLASSENENDWRQAILQADIILDRLLDGIGYTGSDMGEKLRGAQIGDFVTLDAAWEAHKVRNRIAHEGMDFHLSRRETIRVLGLYEKVFNEFSYI
jgi:hypothetical protein